MELRYTHPSECEAGTLLRLLERSYAPLVESEPEIWAQEQKNWKASDRAVFEDPETVGACTFLSWLGKDLVGFFSLDPRPQPIGLVDHNCILPSFRRRGFGSQQIMELLRRLRSMEIREARASTLDHPFFVPAQRMYVRCGFREVRRNSWDRDDRRNLICYAKTIG